MSSGALHLGHFTKKTHPLVVSNKAQRMARGTYLSERVGKAIGYASLTVIVTAIAVSVVILSMKTP